MEIIICSVPSHSNFKMDVARLSCKWNTHHGSALCPSKSYVYGYVRESVCPNFNTYSCSDVMYEFIEQLCQQSEDTCWLWTKSVAMTSSITRAQMVPVLTSIAVHALVDRKWVAGMTCNHTATQYCSMWEGRRWIHECHTAHWSRPWSGLELSVWLRL